MIERKTDLKKALEDKFIKRTLTEISYEMFEAIEEEMKNFSPETKGDIAFATKGTMMIYRHAKRLRFIDMKRRNTKNGKIKKKSYPIHNRIIFGYANEVVKRLSYGFTEDLKKELMKLDGTKI